MKKWVLYICVIIGLGLYISSCNELEDYKSEEVLPQPSATLAVSNVADSSFTLDISTDKSGFLGYVLFKDTLRKEVPAISIISHAYDGESDAIETDAFKFEESGGSQIVEIKKLMPNSYYKLFVASINDDGVDSDVQSFMIKTNDGVGPTFVSSSPQISSGAKVSLNSDIVLTFDEPVKVDPEKKFIFNYFIEDVMEEVTLDETNVSGRTVIVPQPHKGHAGDFFFLSWEAGAVKDLSDNPCKERISGVVGGSLAGNFYRFEFINFNIEQESFIPAKDSILAEHDFVVDINFPYNIYLSDDITPDMVKFRYINWLGTITQEVVAGELCEVVNDTTLRITQPHNANHGDNIAIYIEEGLIVDDYKNINNAFDYAIDWDLGDFMIPDIILPESGSIVTTQEFVVMIKFDFDISLVEGTDKGEVSMRYDRDGAENIYLVEDYMIHPQNDSVLVIFTPQPVDFGSLVYLSIGENVVKDKDGNVNLELQKNVYWSVPKLASSIDVLIGQYIISGMSHFDNVLVKDTVNVELKEGTTDQLNITGLFKNKLGGSETVVGVYDAENSILTIEQQVLGSNSKYIFTVLSLATEDGTLRAYVLEDGTINSDLGLGVYDHDGKMLGLGEYLPKAVWKKYLAKSMFYPTNVTKTMNVSKIERVPKKGIMN